MRKALAALYLFGTILLFAASTSNARLGGPTGPPCFPCTGNGRAIR